MRALGVDSITVQKPTKATDPAGNATVVHFNPPASSTVIDNCSVQPFLLAEKLQFEITAERLFARSTKRVFAPSTEFTRSIDPEDRVLYRGRTYEVFGHVGDWTALDGRDDHVAFIIMLREG